ncbi:hypothetical protein Bpfe_021086 [Biomphalaria pfeifferi]|uniref:Uncharacterized protein n=1 Tax=Biomphalaria pfeifferi TaxID=112525 RepID=A0AAD8F345_BIOPF|nr:hypothetical protein Bpfe_021086 [Biomphalaria pfeifferi]
MQQNGKRQLPSMALGYEWGDRRGSVPPCPPRYATHSLPTSPLNDNIIIILQCQPLTGRKTVKGRNDRHHGTERILSSISTVPQ